MPRPPPVAPEPGGTRIHPVSARSASRPAARIVKDVSLTTEVIQASAALRQTVASTRLQRITLGLSVVAIILAVVGLLVAKH